MTAQHAAPAVTVIICTRNRAHRLADSVASVTAAMEHAARAGIEAELLIVDNGSTDSTPAVIAAAAQEPRVRSTVAPVAGMGRAREHGCVRARGDVILFTDDDVVVPGAWIERMSAPLLAGEADVVSGGVAVPARLRRDWMTPALAAQYFAHNPERPLINPGLAGANMGMTSSVAGRIGLDDQLGTARWPGAEDVLFYVQALEAGYRIRGVDGAAVEHRFDPSRLRAKRLRSVAEGYGRCDAYYYHHWLHTALTMPRLRELKHRAQFGVRWVIARGSPFDESLLRHRRSLSSTGSSRQPIPTDREVLTC